MYVISAPFFLIIRVVLADIDECNLNICQQQCTDTIGSYTCSCRSGYTLSADGISCQGQFTCLNYRHRLVSL